MKELSYKKSLLGIRAKKRLEDSLVFIVVAVLGLITLIPIFWMLRTSIMTNLEIAKYPPNIIPERMLFSNYPSAMTVFPFSRYFVNTVTIVVFCVTGTVITAGLTAYILARIDFRGRSIIFTLIISCMLMPNSVLIIPQFMIWAKLGFIDSYVPLIIPSFLGGGAFYIFLFRQFMLTVPRDMDEAALIDGAGRLRILISIIVPSIKPAIIVVALMAFITNWNDLLGPVIYLSTPEKLTMSYGISRFSGQFSTNYSFVMVAATLTMLPVFIMYLIGQKHFIEGIVLSGLKE